MDDVSSKSSSLLFALLLAAVAAAAAATNVSGVNAGGKTVKKKNKIFRLS